MKHKILNYFSKKPGSILKGINVNYSRDVLEIRMRAGQPLQIITYKRDYFITDYTVTKEDIKKTMLILTENSIYALERQLKEGFITIDGGHRIGFTGEVVIKENKIKTIKNINCLNFRLTREIIGAGDKIIDRIYNYKNNNIFNTLIISPPLCGKTTLLRDFIRILSNGSRKTGIKGKKIGLVDERSEIAGAFKGIAQNNIGKRTDLLDNCPKAKGMMLLIRAMSPEIIAVDEIGKKEDIQAIKEAVNAGVRLITTIHGDNIKSIKKRAGMDQIIKGKIFKRYIILSKNSGIGTIESVLNDKFEEVKSDVS